MKIIVTHLTPDLDAVTSIWLIKRFLPNWQDAQVAFVPAGETYKDEPVDSDPNILHVDTGFGKLDHHQTDEFTCAAKRTLEYIEKQKGKEGSSKFPDEALVRLIDVVNDIDHFKEVYYPNATSDFYDFSLSSQLDGWKFLYGDDDMKLVDLGVTALDGIYKKFKDKVWAEEEIKTGAIEFKTGWGKGLAVETINDEVLRIAQKQGYTLTVRKDPKKHYVRVKALPDSDVDLTSAYREFKKKDSQATWFLHAGRKMILNGSTKNPKSKPTKLSLKEVVEVLKQV